jgi:beta-galactosidase
VLATYGGEFYKGEPAMTVNQFGKGKTYYIGTRAEPRFHTDFYRHLINELGLRRALGVDLPEGVTASVRSDGSREFLFVLGFNRKPVSINLGKKHYRDVLTGKTLHNKLRFAGYRAAVLETITAARKGARR